ncbi:TPA: hypothetical protein WHZ25_000106 [Neisseria meningitidis]
MFDYLKHKIKTYAVNPLTGMVHEKQEALARKTAERAATILFWLTAGLTGIFTLILALLSLSLLIGQLLGSYLYGLFIFTALFILIFLILLSIRKRIETAVRQALFRLLKPQIPQEIQNADGITDNTAHSLPNQDNPT